MPETLYIMGHKNPDTDSICSAIAYAELKKQTGFSAVPVRLGAINQETEFVLSHFNVEIPELLTTVRTQVSDISFEQFGSASPDISIKNAWEMMKKNSYRVVPVVNDLEELVGLVTLSDITRNYMDTVNNNTHALSKTPLKNIVETLNAKLLCGTPDDFNPTGKVAIAAMTPDAMNPFIGKGDIVLTGNRGDNQQRAIELGANCLIITGDGLMDPETLEVARREGCVTMVVPYDTFTAARLINQSIPIGLIMTKNVISFSISDFLDHIKDKMVETRFRSYPVVDHANRVQGFISRYHLIYHRKKNVVLLDHNEKAQTVDGIEQADIIEIIDHHRLGDIQTESPIHVINQPVGSTATIVAGIYLEHKMEIPRQIAGILCAAIISDTLKFKSPTCVAQDKNMVEKLAAIAEVDIEEFAGQLFKSGSSLSGKTVKDLLYNDFKDFHLGKYRIGIGQVNTMDKERIAIMKEDLIGYMEEVCSNARYNVLLLMITDIIAESSEILFVGKDKDLIMKAFQVESDTSSFELKGVVSRKKQVVPYIARTIFS